MSHNDYTLEVISHHSKFSNKSLRKHYVEGIDTVGVWGDEPFEIKFKNLTLSKVQVKISLDGTDILTGKPADTQLSDDMWVVNPLSELSLKAWPETNNGGAAFVFTNANNSVAVHTHGNLSSRGIIAAAVFTEGHVEPTRFCNPIVDHHHHYHYPTYPVYPNYPYYTWSDNTGGIYGDVTFGTITGTTTDCSNSVYQSNSTTAVNLNDSLSELVAVGAGQYVDQKITNVPGLVKPLFSQTVRVKYMWWDDLVSKLREQNTAEEQPSGFPGDKRINNIDLKHTPRVNAFEEAVKRFQQTQMYARF